MSINTSSGTGEKKKRSFFSLDRFYKYPKIILAVILGITGFFALQLPRIQFDNNNFRFIPKGDPARIFSTKVAKTFGDEVMVLIGIKREFSSIIDADFLKSLSEFTDGLLAIDLVRSIQSITTTKHLEGKDDALISEPLIPKNFVGTQAELDQIRYKLSEWDMYNRSFVSDDLKSTQVIVYLDTNEADSGSAEVSAACRKIVSFAESWQHTDTRTYVTGLPVFNQVVNEATAHDLIFLVPLVVLVVVGVLFFSFRRFTGVILPLLTVIISVIWAIGAMPLFGIKLSILATVLPVILVAVGSAYGIHVVSHYFDHVDQSGEISREEHTAQIIWAVKRVIRPVLLAALTTFAGFVSFCFTPAVPISEFGIFSSFGVLVAFAVAVALIPALLILRGPKKPHLSRGKPRKPHEAHRIDQFIVRTFMLITDHKRLVFFLFIVMIALSGLGVSRLIIDNVLMEYFGKSNKIVQSDGFVKKEFGGSKLLTLVVSADEPGMVLYPDVLGAMSDLTDFLHNEVPKVGKVTSLVDLVKRINQVFHADELPPPLRHETSAETAGKVQTSAPVFAQTAKSTQTSASSAQAGTDSFDSFGDFGNFGADEGFGDFGPTELPPKPEVSANQANTYAQYGAADFIQLLDEILFENDQKNLSAADLISALEKKLNYRGSLYYEIPRIPEKYGKTSPEELKGLVENYLVLVSGNSEGFIDNVYSPRQLKMNIQLRTSGQTDTDMVVEKINGFIKARFPASVHVELGGMVQIEKSLTLLVVSSQLISVIVALICVFLILAIYYRSVFAGLIGIIPLSVSILVNFGIMGFTGIKLNIGTALVASFSIGIGIDYTIHYLSAYHLAAMDNKEGRTLLSATFFDSGKAILFNAASVGAGFAVLMLSEFNMLADLGFLIMISMASSSLAALTLLPVMLQILKPRFIKKVLAVDISLKKAGLEGGLTLGV